MTTVSPSPRKPLLSILPETKFSALNLGELWAFRDLLTGLAVRDIKLRYRQTALGVLWVLFQPLAAAGIFAVVFGKIGGFADGSGPPYILLSFAGMLAWNAFASTLTKSGGCLVGNANLVSKVYFPRLTLPLSTVPSTLVDFCIAGLVLAVMLMIYQVNPGWPVLLLPVWMLIVLTMAVGIGLFASALMVSYRDVQYILPVAVQLMLFASPVGFRLRDAADKLGPDLSWFIWGNPLTGVLEGFRWSLVGTAAPPGLLVLYSAGFAAVCFVAGALFFYKSERRFADVI